MGGRLRGGGWRFCCLHGDKLATRRAEPSPRGPSPRGQPDSRRRPGTARPIRNLDRDDGPASSDWGTPHPVPAPAPPEHDYEPIHPGSGRQSWRERLKRYLGPLAVGALLLVTKLKAVLLLLPKLKLLTTSATMVVSIAAYALIWGWSFAVGFVVLLLLHELGHVFQLRREGIPASAPMFIPFLGAVVAAKSMGDDASAEARVGLAGPILGTLATLVPLGIWIATGNEFWQALAYVGFFINLFNLLPVLPLDGGRAMAALSPWMWLVGFAGLLVLTIVFFNPILLLILALRRVRALQALEGAQDARVPRLPRDPRPHPRPGRARLPRAGGRAGDRRRPDLPREVPQRRLTGTRRQSRLRSPGR